MKSRALSTRVMRVGILKKNELCVHKGSLASIGLDHAPLRRRRRPLTPVVCTALTGAGGLRRAARPVDVFGAAGTAAVGQSLDGGGAPVLQTRLRVPQGT